MSKDIETYRVQVKAGIRENTLILAINGWKKWD